MTGTGLAPLPNLQSQPDPSLMRDFLLEVVFDCLLKDGKTPAELAEYARSHDISGIDAARLSNWASGARECNYMDRLATAAAGLTGKSPITLWRRAISQWSEDPTGVTLEARRAGRRDAQAIQARVNRGRRSAR